jgi:ferritin-like metal-binding protein YciE
MTTTINDNLNDWLRDAHAMEQQADKMLNAQADRLEHYPDLRQQLRHQGPRRQADGVRPGRGRHDGER